MIGNSKLMDILNIFSNNLRPHTVRHFLDDDHQTGVTEVAYVVELSQNPRILEGSDTVITCIFRTKFA